jgi:ketosteroid isomerase-like protein
MRCGGRQRIGLGAAAWSALLGCVLLGLCGGNVSAQAVGDAALHTATRTELDVVNVVLAQEKAWNNGDLEGYVKGYKDSPDTLFVGKQVSKRYKEILADYEHNYPKRTGMRTLAFSELEVHTLSDTFAVCLGKYRVDRAKIEGGSAEGLFSLVLEKTDVGWKIVLDHTT